MLWLHLRKGLLNVFEKGVIVAAFKEALNEKTDRLYFLLAGNEDPHDLLHDSTSAVCQGCNQSHTREWPHLLQNPAYSSSQKRLFRTVQRLDQMVNSKLPKLT